MVSDAHNRPLKGLAREIFLATLAEVDVGRAFARKVERCGGTLHFGGPSASLPSTALGTGGTSESVDLDAFREIWVIGFGKVAWAMFDGLLETLGEQYRPRRGIVVSNVAPRSLPAGFVAFQAGHPYPNEQSLAAAEAILELLRAADERTLVFFLVSGGGSALVEKPLEPGVTLEDVQALNRALVGCGASIDEINALRKHLSGVKGGRLAEAAASAHQVTFLLSDVPEGNWATIASGPTLPDPTTVDTCYEVAGRYNLLGKLPPAIRSLFEKKKLRETPKPGAPSTRSAGSGQASLGASSAFRRSQTFLLLSSRDVLHAAHRAAGARGFLAECEMTCDDWALEPAAECLLGRLGEMQRENPDQPLCLISAGEILCPVTGDGQGGRNQAFVLHCVEKIAGSQVAVLSGGTDGIDGNSLAAGAVADGETLARAREKGLDPWDYFRRSDSFRFFDALGDTLVIGPQPNNLRDLRLLLAR